MVKRPLNPATIGKPLARYSHGMEIAPGARLVVTSGQLAVRPDGSVPADCEAQVRQCFANVAAILAEAGMNLADVVRINAFVTKREDMPAYMKVRDELFPDTPPASTLMAVVGFARPEFLAEIEVIAAKAD